MGDSRGYPVRNGSAVQLTRDQSFVQELIDAGALTEEAAERSEYRNRILQALGGKAEVDIVLTYHALRGRDVLLLCSDGLSGVVAREEIAETAGRGADLAAICEELIERANSRGGPDNITVIMARLGGDRLNEAAPDEGVTPRSYELTDS